MGHEKIYRDPDERGRGPPIEGRGVALGTRKQIGEKRALEKPEGSETGVSDLGIRVGRVCMTTGPPPGLISGVWARPLACWHRGCAWKLLQTRGLDSWGSQRGKYSRGRPRKAAPTI